MKKLKKTEVAERLHKAFDDIFNICTLLDLNITQKHLQEYRDFMAKQITASYKLE